MHRYHMKSQMLQDANSRQLIELFIWSVSNHQSYFNCLDQPVTPAKPAAWHLPSWKKITSFHLRWFWWELPYGSIPCRFSVYDVFPLFTFVQRPFLLNNVVCLSRFFPFFSLLSSFSLLFFLFFILFLELMHQNTIKKKQIHSKSCYLDSLVLA